MLSFAECLAFFDKTHSKLCLQNFNYSVQASMYHSRTVWKFSSQCIMLGLSGDSVRNVSCSDCLEIQFSMYHVRNVWRFRSQCIMLELSGDSILNVSRLDCLEIQFSMHHAGTVRRFGPHCIMLRLSGDSGVNVSCSECLEIRVSMYHVRIGWIFGPPCIIKSKIKSKSSLLSYFTADCFHTSYSILSVIHPCLIVAFVDTFSHKVTCVCTCACAYMHIHSCIYKHTCR